MGFKENLRKLREEAGLTQAEIAKKAGVPFRSYQNWEAGSREPRIQGLAALAAALRVTVDQLISSMAASYASPPAPPAKESGLVAKKLRDHPRKKQTTSGAARKRIR